jgi:hypothetical protein
MPLSIVVDPSGRPIEGGVTGVGYAVPEVGTL